MIQAGEMKRFSIKNVRFILLSFNKEFASLTTFLLGFAQTPITGP